MRLMGNGHAEVTCMGRTGQSPSQISYCADVLSAAPAPAVDPLVDYYSK